MLSGAQLGITLTTLLTGYTFEPAISSLLRGPLSLDGVPTAVHKVPPQLGEDTVDILTGAGLTPEQIDDLIDRGVAHTPRAHASTTGGPR